MNRIDASRRRLMMSGVCVAGLTATGCMGAQATNDADFLQQAHDLLKANPAIDIHAHPGRTFGRDAPDLSPALKLMSGGGPSEDRALAEMRRVLKPGGKLLVLEFSRVAKPLEKAYDWYSFKVLPRLGALVAGDETSYRYLAESIRMHPAQGELKALMHAAGFGHVDYHNLTGGMVALHVGIKC